MIHIFTNYKANADIITHCIKNLYYYKITKNVHFINTLLETTQRKIHMLIKKYINYTIFLYHYKLPKTVYFIKNYTKNVR